jgi:hypothetical protein
VIRKEAQVNRSILGGGCAALLALVAGCSLFGHPGDSYTVYVGAQSTTDRNAPELDGTVQVTVDGKVKADKRTGFPYVHDFPVQAGQRIVVRGTSAHYPVTCNIAKGSGPGQKTVAFAEPSAFDQSAGVWRGGCSWTRP